MSMVWERCEMGRLKSSRKCSATAVLGYPGFLIPAETLAEWKESSCVLNRAYFEENFSALRSLPVE